MSYLTTTLFVIVTVLSGVLSYQISGSMNEKTFGAFGDPFLSIQLAGSPANGECLSTDGTNNDWITCASGSGGGTDGNFTFFNGSGVRLATTSNQVVINGTATTSLDKLTVFGGTLGNYFYATSTTASSTFPLLQSTHSTSTNATSTNLEVTNGFRLGGVTVKYLFGSNLSLNASEELYVDCSEIASTGLTCSGETLQLAITPGYALDFTNPILDFDTTEIVGANTWGAGGAASVTWTWNNSGAVDPALTFGDDLISTDNNLTLSSGNLTITGTSDGCATFASGVLGSTGSACGSGGGASSDKWATSTSPLLSIYPNSALRIGIGTTTPRWALQVASSTGAQFTLSDQSLTSNHWSLRSINSNFYLSTSSPTTFATSSTPIIHISSTGTTTFSGVGAATSTIYIYSTASAKGGSIIMEDIDGAGCTELYVLNGVMTATTVTCPSEI